MNKKSPVDPGFLLSAVPNSSVRYRVGSVGDNRGCAGGRWAWRIPVCVAVGFDALAQRCNGYPHDGYCGAVAEPVRANHGLEVCGWAGIAGPGRSNDHPNDHGYGHNCDSTLGHDYGCVGDVDRMCGSCCDSHRGDGLKRALGPNLRRC